MPPAAGVGPDTRWRLFMWDAEAAFDLGGTPDFTGEASLRPVVISSVVQSFLASLLVSPHYQAYFTAQAEQHLAGVLATESVRRRLAVLAATLRPVMAAEAARWWPAQEPAAAVTQWEAALQRISYALEANAQRLRRLSNPATLRSLLPQLPVPAAPAPAPPLPPDTRIALLVHRASELTKGDAAVVALLKARGATVIVIDTAEGGTHDPAQVAASHDLLLLSASVRVLDTAARYAQTTTPLIFWGPQLLAPTKLALQGSTRDHETYIRDCSHRPSDHCGATH